MVLILTFGNVQIKEVAVESRLYATSNNCYKIIESLKVESVDPVDDVKGTVQAEKEQVMACDGFCFTSLGYHE